ncbi:MAG: hypothetical protein GW903_06330 [Alphaproteobacteria bacterium]|nr:hypothetical protein [Alphaproteobacteria bacterium]NCQ88498.1 hypothetical protein [Alphaproteobacteria bacterium]NCT06041.1 hypothetical protein [Alphaproteobacteria bacterium]
MNTSLTAQQIELLHAKLIVPIAVNDILNYGLEVEPDMQYGLHEALSEIDPDSALLAIALSAQHIAEQSKTVHPIAGGLYAECVQIVADYGPNFIRDLKRGSLPEADFLDVLMTVPEDLEALADLLDALSAEHEDELAPIVVLSNLLSIQARAHMEIANYILEEAGRIDKESAEDFFIYDKEPEMTQDAIISIASQQQAQVQTDNIILFPIHLRH